MAHIEQTPNALATYSEPMFRTYPPEWVKAQSRGEEFLMQLCEEIIEGKWESFYSIRGRRQLPTHTQKVR